MSEAQDSHHDLIELSVPAQPTSVDLVHEAIDRLWAGLDSVGAVDRIRFETAVIEIFANIVEHAFRSDADLPDGLARRLDLRLEAGEEEITALFSDNGLPAELDLSDVTLPDDDAESGRGLAMALAALDDLHYERVEGRNRWSLVCRRAGA